MKGPLTEGQEILRLHLALLDFAQYDNVKGGLLVRFMIKDSRNLVILFYDT